MASNLHEGDQTSTGGEGHSQAFIGPHLKESSHCQHSSEVEMPGSVPCSETRQAPPSSGYLSPGGYSSPHTFGEIKINFCKPSAEDRLRLIQVLQELDLEHALDVLPDDCTLDSLLWLSYECFKSTLCQSLSEGELIRFWEKLKQMPQAERLPYGSARRVSGLTFLSNGDCCTAFVYFWQKTTCFACYCAHSCTETACTNPANVSGQFCLPCYLFGNA